MSANPKTNPKTERTRRNTQLIATKLPKGPGGSADVPPGLLDPWAAENQRIYDEKESRISGDDKKSL